MFIIAASGGKPRPVTDGSNNCYVPDWSRDGKWIYFTSDRTGSAEVWRMPVAGGATERMTFAGGMAGRESPDGKFVYFTKLDRDGLWRAPLADRGKEELSIAEIGKEMWGNWDFGPDGIYYLATTSSGAGGELRFVSGSPPSVRVVRKLTRRPLNWDRGLSVSPSGRTVIDAQADRIGSDLSLVEHFR